MNTYNTEIQTIIRPLFIGFILIWDIVVVTKLLQNPQQEYFFLFVGFGIFATGFVIRQLFAKLEISISENGLLLKYKIFSLTFKTKSYLIKEMKQISKEYNVNENSSWGGQGFRIYYKTPVILTFNYLNKKILVGKTFSWPNIDETINELETRKRKKNPA